jgi:hypothetical protein
MNQLVIFTKPYFVSYMDILPLLYIDVYGRVVIETMGILYGLGSVTLLLRDSGIRLQVVMTRQNPVPGRQDIQASPDLALIPLLDMFNHEVNIKPNTFEHGI